MKLRQVPEDFTVIEEPKIELKAGGGYSIYELTKTSLDSFGAKKIIAHRHGIPYKSISFAGLKDKHAKTTQYVSIKGAFGNALDFAEKNIVFRFVGFSDKPIKVGDIVRNRFEITVRDLKKKDTDRVAKELDSVRKFGIPNYFDSQRFGSIRGSGEFIAKRLIERDFEGALRIYLTSISRYDHSEVKKSRRVILANWGDWSKCLEIVGESKKIHSERKILSFLKENPGDFRGGFMLIEDSIKELFVSAYQSFLWNECVKDMIKKRVDDKDIFEVEYTAGSLLFYRQLDEGVLEDFGKMQVPLLNHETKMKDSGMREVVDIVLDREKITQDKLNLGGVLGGIRFGTRDRSMLFFSERLEVSNPEADELNRGKFKVKLKFSLNKGSYATILVKRFFGLVD